MAYIYGNAAQGGASSRRKDVLLRLVLPLLFVLVLACVALYAFRQQQHWLTAIFAVFFVASVLRFEELGLTVSHYLSHSQTNARAGQVVAKALEELPNEYHVFHDLHFDGGRIDHGVIGPNGLFLIRTSSHLGNISASGESLRLNGWPFLMDVLTGCWNQTQKLTRHLGLHYTAGVRPCPVLCFSRASVGIMGPVRGALVVEAGNLAEAILAHDGDLTTDKMTLLVDKFAELVGVGTENPVCTRHDAPTSTGPQNTAPKPNLPACAKCGHKATPLEFELFPGECPKCGRLYGAAREEPETPQSAASRNSIWRPGTPQLVMAALLVAAGAGYLAYTRGVTDFRHDPAPPSAPAPDQVFAAPAASALPPGQDVDAANRTTPAGPAADTAEQSATAGQSAESQAPAAASQDAAMLHPDSPLDAPAEEPVPVRDGPQAAAGPTADMAANATAVTDAPVPDAAPANATTRAAQTPPPADAPAAKAADPFDQGRLVITSARPVTVWFKNQQTFKEFGPYEIGGKKDILLPKGFYSVVYLENGKRRQTTMSFLSDHGQLDF